MKHSYFWRIKLQIFFCTVYYFIELWRRQCQQQQEQHEQRRRFVSNGNDVADVVDWWKRHDNDEFNENVIHEWNEFDIFWFLNILIRLCVCVWKCRPGYITNIKWSEFFVIHIVFVAILCAGMRSDESTKLYIQNGETKQMIWIWYLSWFHD